MTTATTYLRDLDPAPLIARLSYIFGMAHAHLMSRPTREYKKKRLKWLCRANTKHRFVESYVNKNGKPDYRPKRFVQKAVENMIGEATATLHQMFPCFFECNFCWVERECPMKLMNALNLFFHCGLLFKEPFPPLHDLPISNDTIYTNVEASDCECEGSLQKNMVENESNNEGSSHEQGGIAESDKGLGQTMTM